MDLMTVLPAAAVVLFVIATLTIGLRRQPAGRNAWLLPATLSLLFLVYSVVTIASEGLLGFWNGHTRDLWGNQIWFDLLLAIGIAWSFIVPAARKLGMRVWPWLALIMASGCIGLLAMLSRYLWLRERTAAPATAMA